MATDDLSCHLTHQETYQSASHLRVTTHNREERASSIEDEDDTIPTTAGQIFQLPKARIKLIAWIVKLVLFVSVLTCLVFSKITLVKLFAELHLLSNFSNTSSSTSNLDAIYAARLYWMLLFIIMIPSIVTWLRSVLGGLLSKSPRRPWPRRASIIGVS